MRPIYWLWCYVVAPLLYPLTNFILPLNFLWFRKRKIFEELNRWDKASKSFKEEGEKAYVTFEVSSEGELEQIRPLVDHWLSEKKKIELIYCSPSVENGMQKIYKHYPQQVRLFRLPLLTYWPHSESASVSGWMTSSTLVLCRYDFFPELMLIGLRTQIFFVLIAATLKDKVKVLKSSFHPLRFYWNSVYHSFNRLWVSTPVDKERLIGLLDFSPDWPQQVDFRVLQIMKRLELKESCLNAHPFFTFLTKILSSFPKERRFILGSFWPQDMGIFESDNMKQMILKKELFPVVVPHQLSHEKMVNCFSSLSIPIYFMSPDDNDESLSHLVKNWMLRPGIVILLFKGILCELYGYFGQAYVGGGFGRSIHSVLEPYLAGCRIYVGPQVKRSTEFDLVRQLSPHEIHLLERPELFEVHFSENGQKEIIQEFRDKLLTKMGPQLQAFLQSIEQN